MKHALTAPAFAGLKWYPQGDGYIAHFTRIYGMFWAYEHAELTRIGFSTTREGYTCVLFDPNVADPYEVEATLQALMIKRAANIESIEGPARRRAEKEQRRLDASTRASSVYDLYGPACVKSQTMALYMKRQGPGDDIELGKLVLATEAKVAVFEAEARARQHEPVPASTAAIPDEVVERAIRALTALDADHAEMANEAGWSKSTTLGGHCCNRLLETDRPLALVEGRRLISKHLVQLAKLGIIDWVVAQGRAA